MAIETDNMVVWPSPFLFWTKVENHEELKKSLLPKIKEESKKEEYHTVPGKIHRMPGAEPGVWDCEVITSYFNMAGSKDLFTQDVTSLIVRDALRKFYADPHCPVPQKPKKSILLDVWFNSYKPGYWQETHAHHGSTYSGIYILELNEENGTTFYDPIGTDYNYARAGKKIYTTEHIKEGNVLLFPSEFPHSVRKCSSERTTISFNVKCEW